MIGIEKTKRIATNWLTKSLIKYPGVTKDILLAMDRCAFFEKASERANKFTNEGFFLGIGLDERHEERLVEFFTRHFAKSYLDKRASE